MNFFILYVAAIVAQTMAHAMFTDEGSSTEFKDFLDNITTPAHQDYGLSVAQVASQYLIYKVGFAVHAYYLPAIMCLGYVSLSSMVISNIEDPKL